MAASTNAASRSRPAVLKQIIDLILQEIINLISVISPLDKKKPYADKSLNLKKEGICFWRKYLDDNQINKIKQKTTTFINNTDLSKTHTLSSGCEIYARKDWGADLGMIDIKHCHLEFSELNEILNNKDIMSIIKNATGREIVPLDCNIYLSTGVQTRGFHVDNTQPEIFKAFIYLTDVPDTDYGPYTFIKKSHRFSLSTYYSLVRNLIKMDQKPMSITHFINKNKQVICTGKKGDLIISSQNGHHRGMPQKDKKHRQVLVLSYLSISKLNRLHSRFKAAAINASEKNQLQT